MYLVPNLSNISNMQQLPLNKVLSVSTTVDHIIIPMRVALVPKQLFQWNVIIATQVVFLLIDLLQLR
jgi:hypothetical protein